MENTFVVTTFFFLQICHSVVHMVVVLGQSLISTLCYRSISLQDCSFDRS